MYYLWKFSEKELPRIRRAHTAGAQEARDSYVDVIAGQPYDAAGVHRSSTGVTTYPLKAEIWGQEPLPVLAEARALEALQGTVGKLWRRWYDGRVDWIWARCHSVKAELGSETYRAVPVELVFKTTMEFWQNHHHGPGWLLDSGVKLDDGYCLDEHDFTVLAPPNDSWLITNEGNAPQYAPIITLWAGPATGNAGEIRVKAPWANCAWSFFGDFRGSPDGVADGSSLVIDCGLREVYLNGVAAGRYFRRLAQHRNSYWLELQPGNNMLDVAWDGDLESLRIKAEYWGANH